jgi:ATP-dependent DNA helicase DinG
VNLARKEAMAADVVVINHHLFFADLNVRESGMAELLPTVRVTVFDEAHQLNEIGVNFLGQQLSTGQLIDLGRDLLGAGLQLARGLADWSALVSVLEKSARDLRLTASEFRTGSRLRWTDLEPSSSGSKDWRTFNPLAMHACSPSKQWLNWHLILSGCMSDFHRYFSLFDALKSLAQKSRFAGLKLACNCA